MHKRSVRLKDKENQQQNHQSDDNNNNKSQSNRTFYLIVEAAVSSEDSRKSQYWLINSNSIVDIPVINPETVYTGKTLKFRGTAENVCSGTCVLFSPDFAFVQTQFRQITATMEPEKTVLNNSTKGNILGLSNKRLNGNAKLPSAITIKPVGKHGARKDENGFVEMPRLGDPDAENRPPTQVMIIGGNGGVNNGANKVMTFDQQSQTDEVKMFDSVIPATASQMHQQSNQMAQLIRANNALVQEVNQLREDNSEIKKTMSDMKDKLNQTLALLLVKPRASAEPAGAKPVVEEVSVSETEAVYMSNEENNYQRPYDLSLTENSMDCNSSVVTAATSREQSLARSTTPDYTPPLKKNKAKLRMSQQSLDVPLAENGEYVALGPNGTVISKNLLLGLNHGSYSTVTRKILAAVFDRETLASHSLTGKPSPAFLDRGAKNQLDANKIADIISYVSNRCNVTETVIRSVITSKCADENKMMRLHAKKRASIDSGCDLSTKRRQTTFN